MSDKKNNFKETLTVSMSNFLDAGAIVAGASGLTLWMNFLHLDDMALGLLGAVSANGFGAALGALIGGPLADKYGRKFIYRYDLLVYMIGVALIALSMNFPMLLVGYIITGIAVGAVVPASWSYLGEQAPAGKRCANIGWGQFSWGFAPMTIFILSIFLNRLGLLGNRIMFGMLFAVALITWILQQQIQESKIWEEQKEKEKEEGYVKAPTSEIFTIKANRQAFILSAGIYTLWNLVAGLQGYFLPYIFTKIGNLNNIQSNALNAFIWFMTILFTYLVFIKKGDEWNRKIVFSVGCIMEVVAWLVLVFAPVGWFSLIFFDLLWGISAGFSAQCFFALWSVELFKTQYRGKAQGIIFFLVRAGVGVISLVFPTMLTALGFQKTGMFLVAVLIIQLIIGLIYTPETRGMSVYEIEEQRYGNDY
ncbi:MFS transporter [Clostridium luticellarii]|jgi:inositol transporter-like SP family MFS transporter|uniref:MFS transporter n=1 Tax=Clostridium luticellarii TaxID=1691940 RepID=UPI002353BB3D|nr:MFS transporter [Clostridium luticellarii]MCI1946410.1 MFS transporter [Clostridium luticellarii]MCI1969032.1 MFS transporter [Clostridium luticellarii]MCI1996222.1 MFS transporter [Clostridium luticellarii]MCI2040523.1 MFS transporter [Clostridium luticellarii]